MTMMGEKVFNREDPEITHTGEVRENTERILSKEDREILEYTLHEFKNYLEGIEKNKLPSVIILPETSMRPIFYALKPIIDKRYSKEGVPFPDVRFLLVNRFPKQYDPTYDKNRLDRWRDGCGENYASDEKYIAEVERTKQELEKRKKEHPEIFLSEAEIEQRADAWKGERTARFKEIIETSHHGNILVVDDYLNSFESLDQIEEMRNLLPPNISMNYFILVDGRGSYNPPMRDYDSLIKTGIRPSRGGLGFEKTSLWAFPGFSYGARGKTPWLAGETKKKISPDGKGKLIGAVKPKKPSKYVVRTDSPDVEKASQIRGEMREIGVMVAGTDHFDKEEWFNKLTPDWGDF